MMNETLFSQNTFTLTAAITGKTQGSTETFTNKFLFLLCCLLFHNDHDLLPVHASDKLSDD